MTTLVTTLVTTRCVLCTEGSLCRSVGELPLPSIQRTTLQSIGLDDSCVLEGSWRESCCSIVVLSPFSYFIH